MECAKCCVTNIQNASNSKTHSKSNFEARALWMRTRTGINWLRPDLWYHSFLHTPKTQKLNTPQNSKCTQSKKSMNGTDFMGCAHHSLIFYSVCLLNFGVCSVFEFLVCEGMNDTTNLAVVDLSPYGFVFKELALQTLILNEFLSFLFFCKLCYNSFCTLQKSFCTTGFYGGYPQAL